MNQMRDFTQEELMAFHPGSYIIDVLDELNMTIVSFAEYMGMEIIDAKKLLYGMKPLNKTQAKKVAELSGGTSTELWLGLQSAYDEAIKFNLQNRG